MFLLGVLFNFLCQRMSFFCLFCFLFSDIFVVSIGIGWLSNIRHEALPSLDGNSSVQELGEKMSRSEYFIILWLFFVTQL